MASNDPVPHAVVIGGSMAGMLAARALAEHARVTIVERDSLSDSPTPRRGVPQAHHLHALLLRGLSLLEGWFPGLRDDLVADGAIALDGGSEIGWLGPFGWWSGYESGRLESVWASRAFMDAHVLARLRREPRIAWREETRVAGLAFDVARSRVTGVRTESGDTLDADLVVDTTGRGSALPAWLRAHGLREPAESVVDSGLSYASAFVRLGRSIPNGWKAVFVLGAPPHMVRGGVLSLVEGGRAIATFVASAPNEPPVDPPSALVYARTLRCPILADVLTGAEWLTPVRTSRSTANVRRRYERLDMPAGVIAMGDAMCAFNPAYGQGMSVAAMQASELGKLVARRGVRDASVGARAHSAFARAAEFPWAAATGEDFRQPTTRGTRAPGLRLIHAYMNRLNGAAVTDPEIALRLGAVLSLVASPLTLYSPRMLRAALRPSAPSPLLGPIAVPRRCAAPADHASVGDVEQAVAIEAP